MPSDFQTQSAASAKLGIGPEAMTTGRRLKTISPMRFDSFSSKPPPPLALSWRMVLWAVGLVPALLILGWSLRQARLPKPDPAAMGRTADETQRLKRILKHPREDAASRLHDDTVRVVASSGTSNLDSSESRTAPVDRDVRLDKSILATIKDNTFGVTAAEKPAYDAILAKVRGASLEELESSVLKDVPFALLMLDSNRYRGEILAFEGDVRRLNKMAVSSDEPTVGESFEAWLFTADSGLNPYRVVLASLPGGIPLGDELKPPIRARIIGYFFKRYSYATANDYHTAPMVLAKTLTLLRPSNSDTVLRSRNSRTLTYLAIGILAVFVVGGVVAEMAFCRRMHPRPRLSEDDLAFPPDLAWPDRQSSLDQRHHPQ